MSDFWKDAEIISSYSRAQAIEDGVLVDLMQTETAGAVREAGFRYPIAMTSAAFELAVWPIDNEEANKWLEGKCQDLQGRLWDVLSMLKRAAKRGGSEVRFQISVWNYQTKRRNVITLKSVCGPDDDGSPCITIMLPHED
jgi:hypothetical protein